VNENLDAAQGEAGLTREEVVQLARNSFEIGWLTPDERAGLLRRIDLYVGTA
jgi:adenosine deaminase